MLKGQAKTDYQREYMRRRRSNSGSNNMGLTGSNIETKLKAVGLTVEGNKVGLKKERIPNCSDGRYREIDADGNAIPEYT